MTQQVFDQMIGEPPPSTVDVDGVIARERRSARRRRAAGVGTAGLLAFGLAFGAATFLGIVGAPLGPPDAAAGSPSSPTPWPPDTVARIEREMRDVVPRVAPGVQLSDVTRSGAWGLVDNPKLTDPPNTGKPDGVVDSEVYGMRMTVELGGRQGSLMINVDHRFGEFDFPGCSAGHRGCEEITTPEGWRVKIQKQVTSAEAGSMLIDGILLVDRGNGVLVSVIHFNDLGDVPDDEPNRDPAPLTLDQLKQIALDPALTPSP